MKIIIKWLKSLFKTEDIKQYPKKRKRSFEEKLLSASDDVRDTYYRELAHKQKSTDEHIKENYSKKIDIRLQTKRLLMFEFVPYNQSNRNVRSYLEFTTGNFEKWQSIRNYFEKLSDNKCSICGHSSTEFGFNHHTECHEVWYYDYNTKTQILKKLESLCIMCHKTKHSNQHINDKEQFSFLMQWYSACNKITLEETTKEYDNALNTRKTRNNARYKLDLSYLKQFNIDANIFDCHDEKFNNFVDRWKIQNDE